MKQCIYEKELFYFTQKVYFLLTKTNNKLVAKQSPWCVLTYSCLSCYKWASHF